MFVNTRQRRRLCRVFTNIYSLSIKKDGHASRNISIQFPCVCVCLSLLWSLQFLVKVFTFLSLNLWNIQVTNVLQTDPYNCWKIQNFSGLIFWKNYSYWKTKWQPWIFNPIREEFDFLLPCFLASGHLSIFLYYLSSAIFSSVFNSTLISWYLSYILYPFLSCLAFLITSFSSEVKLQILVLSSSH